MQRGEREIRAAAEEMQKAATRNEAKGDWRIEPIGRLFEKLREEEVEFYEAVLSGDKQRIHEELGDMLWTGAMIASHGYHLGGRRECECERGAAGEEDLEGQIAALHKKNEKLKRQLVEDAAVYQEQIAELEAQGNGIAPEPVEDPIHNSPPAKSADQVHEEHVAEVTRQIVGGIGREWDTGLIKAPIFDPGESVRLLVGDCPPGRVLAVHQPDGREFARYSVELADRTMLEVEEKFLERGAKVHRASVTVPDDDVHEQGGME